MVKLDITVCFLSFQVHKDDLKFFFCEAGGDYYQFLSLVFGRKDVMSQGWCHNCSTWCRLQ